VKDESEMTALLELSLTECSYYYLYVAKMESPEIWFMLNRLGSVPNAGEGLLQSIENKRSYMRQKMTTVFDYNNDDFSKIEGPIMAEISNNVSETSKNQEKRNKYLDDLIQAAQGNCPLDLPNILSSLIEK
jgi:hypothetical protein